MSDVKDPARIPSQITDQCFLNLRPGQELRVDLLLKQPIVEEALCTIGLLIHRNETHDAFRRIERLSKPVSIARNFGRR